MKRIASILVCFAIVLSMSMFSPGLAPSASAASSEAEAAKAAFAEANRALEQAQTEYDAALRAVSNKNSEIQEINRGISSVEADLSNARADKTQAEAALEAANEELKRAQAQKAAAEKALSDYQQGSPVSLTSYDFFVWLSGKSGQSAAVKQSAAAAARILKNEMTSEDKAAIENDGGISSAFERKQYSEIIGYTHIGETGDATNWDNFKYALELVAKGNEYRAKENLTALTVSSVMMAMAEINANYQATLDGIGIAHTSSFLSLENLASNGSFMGSSYGYPEPVFKEYDPFDGWYTREKKVYDYLAAHNLTYSSLTGEQKEEIKSACGLSNTGEVQIGHYLTLTDRNNNIPMKSAGFGYINSSRQYINNDTYRTDAVEKYSHVFGFSRSYAEGNDGISCADYSALAEEYEAEASAGGNEEELRQAVADADTAVENAGKAVADAERANSNASSAVSQYENALAEANAGLETAQSELAQLQSALNAKQAALDEAKRAQAEAKARLEKLDPGASEDAARRAAAEKTAAEAKARSVKTVRLNAKTVSAAAIDNAVRASGGSSRYVTEIEIGKNVRKISANALKAYPNVKTLVIKSKKLKKSSVKKSLKGSGVTGIKISVGSKKQNRKYVKKYNKIFTKKNAGKKVKVK